MSFIGNCSGVGQTSGLTVHGVSGSVVLGIGKRRWNRCEFMRRAKTLALPGLSFHVPAGGHEIYFKLFCKVFDNGGFISV